MYFLIKDKKMFDKYNEIWVKVSNIIKKNLIEFYDKKNKLYLQASNIN